MIGKAIDRFRLSFFFLLVTGLLMIPVSSWGAEVTIKFWHAMSGKRIELLKNLSRDFEKSHPGIKVDVQYTGSYNDTLNKTISAIRAGLAPHIFHLYEIGTLGMIDGGMIVPIDDLSKGRINWNDYIDVVVSYYTVRGKVYSMPFNSSTPILFYNKTFFQKAGLNPNQPPDTWNRVEKAGKQIIDRGVAEFGVVWNLHSWYFEQFHAVMGAKLANNDNGRSGRPTKVLINQAPGIRIMKWWTDMEKKKIFANVGRGWANHRKAFISGQAAMMMSSTSDVTMMENAFAEKGWALGTAYIPRPDDTKRTGAIIGGGTLWITKDHPANELEAAFQFVKWMSEAPQQVRWHKGTGYFPIHKGARKLLEREGWFKKYPNFATAFQQLDDSKPGTATQGALMGIFPEFRNLVQSAFEEVYQGKKDPRTALNDAAVKANKALADYNKLYK